MTQPKQLARPSCAWSMRSLARPRGGITPRNWLKNPPALPSGLWKSGTTHQKKGAEQRLAGRDARGQDIRTVIEANAAELATFRPLHAANALVAIGSGAQREVTTYHLNEEQALLICMLYRPVGKKDICAKMALKMANSTVSVKCGQCTIVAVLSPAGGGYTYSVLDADKRQCPVIRARALHSGTSAPDIDCDHLLDAVSGEYRRLQRR